MNEQLKRVVKTGLQRAGLDGRDVAAVRDWWKVRQQGLRSRRGFLVGTAVVWTENGRTELAPVEVAVAGPGQITVETLVTAISPGTEKAWYLGLPNAKISYPFRPGYSGCGRVVAVGDGVAQIAVGDLVAVRGLKHQSIQTLPAEKVFPIPDECDPESAALIELAVIAGWGINQAGDLEGRELAVLGAGMIGALGQRLAIASGATATTLVAASRAKARASHSAGAFRTLDEIDAREDTFATVIDATADPTSLARAVARTEPGGSVVLLGSPRGPAATLDVDAIREGGVSLVGSHISLLEQETPEVRAAVERAAVALLTSSSSELEPLITHRLSPTEAGLFYRRELHDRSVIGAVIDWTRLPSEERSRTRRASAGPVVRIGGWTMDDRPAAGAALAPSPAAAHRTIGFALVGCGEIALQNAPALSAAAGAQIVACYDPAVALAHEVAGPSRAAVLTNIDDLLGTPEVEVVVIAVPHHLHELLAVQALAAGKHVVVEKPLAHNLDSARRIVAAAATAQGQLTVCFPQRFDDPARQARQLVDAGALGEIQGFSITFAQDRPPSYWAGGLSGRSQSSWRSQRELAGGGVLIMNACHFLDLLAFLTPGRRATLAMALARTEVGRDVETTLSATIELDNGAVGTLTASTDIRGARRNEVRIWGSDGHLELMPEPRYFALAPWGRSRPARWTALATSPGHPERQRYFEDVAAAVSANRPAEITGRDGLVVQALIDAIYRSAASRSAVAVAPSGEGA